MPKIIIRQTELPDATVNVNGALLTTVPSGATATVGASVELREEW